jgi:hypothetical protein
MTQPLPEQPPVDADEQQSLRDRLNDRKVLAAIGAAVVVVAALGLFVVKPLVSGSSSNSADNYTVPRHVVKPTTSASASPSGPVAAATPAPQLKVRDPFSPLVVAPVAAAVSPSPTTSAQPSTPTIVVVQPSASPTNATYTLKLVSVAVSKTDASADTATVLLNGKSETIKLGQSFPSATDGPFQLTFVSSVAADPSHNSAQFAYGDETFSLASGETKTES